MTRRDSASRPLSRRRSASANVTGTAALVSPLAGESTGACQRPSRSTSEPSPISPASISSTRNGSPSARCTTSDWTASGRSAAPRHSRAIRAVSAALRRARGSTAAEPRACKATASSPARVASPARVVPRHSTRSVVRLSARNSSRASVSRSAQCRSSRISRQPAAGASARSSRSTASPRNTSESSPPGRPGCCHSGTSWLSTGRNGSSSWLSGTRPARLADVSASANGRKGVGTSLSTARPVSTAMPAAPAALAASRTSRDLPTPASPVTSTVPPRPAPASARAAATCRVSSSRATSTGHSTCRTPPVSVATSQPSATP
jgi:hypothetical protein